MTDHSSSRRGSRQPHRESVVSIYEPKQVTKNACVLERETLSLTNAMAMITRNLGWGGGNHERQSMLRTRRQVDLL